MGHREGIVVTGSPAWVSRAKTIVADPVFTIASGSGIASFAMNFWIPFLPLFMLDLGATGDANALFWVGVATTVQGVGRLVSGPLWGILSDRFGRKLMFMRALYFASATTAIAAFATEPWHVAVAFACQGLFSGFIPAGVALTSVTVPDSRLNASLSLVTSAQYLGNTLGPAMGALLALVVGIRGAIVVSAIMPALSATMVMFLVPRDATGRTTATSTTPGTVQAPPAPSFWRNLTLQFGLSLFLYFFLFGANQLVRLASPLALADLHGGGDVESIVGVAFTLAGVASMVGVLVIGRRYFTMGRFRPTIVLACSVTAVAHVALAASPTIVTFVLAFSVISLVQAAMLPASNTLIASNVPRERRGTAFGLAGSAQALAFMVGPMTAAWFAATSMMLGFAAVGSAFLALALLLWLTLKEPILTGDRPTGGAR